MHNIIKNIRRMATILEARATEREREREKGIIRTRQKQ